MSGYAPSGHSTKPSSSGQSAEKVTRWTPKCNLATMVALPEQALASCSPALVASPPAPASTLSAPAPAERPSDYRVRPVYWPPPPHPCRAPAGQDEFARWSTLVLCTRGRTADRNDR